MIRMPNVREKQKATSFRFLSTGIFQMYHCPADQVSLWGGVMNKMLKTPSDDPASSIV